MIYTEAQRALAVEIVERHGGTVTQEALQEVRDALQSPNLPRMSVWRWLNSQAVTGVTDSEKNLKSLEGSQVVVTTRAKAWASRTLDEMFEEVATRYLEHALEDDVIDEVRGQSAVTAAAIATDKMRLLRGLPTEIIAMMPGLVNAIQERGLNPTAVFQAIYDRLALPPDTKRIGRSDVES